MSMALLALQERLAAARPVVSRVNARDRQKLLALLWMGRNQARLQTFFWDSRCTDDVFKLNRVPLPVHRHRSS